MGSMSNWMELEVLDHISNVGAFTPAGTLWMAIFTVKPTDSSGSGTEVSGTGYTRAKFSNSTSTWSVAAAGAIENIAEISFPSAGAGGWGTVTGFAMFTSSNSGNAYYWASLTSSKAVGSGDTAKFATGDIDITLD